MSKATLVAYGVSETGEREVIGVEVTDGEMEDGWRKFLAELVVQGLRGVMLVSSDEVILEQWATVIPRDHILRIDDPKAIIDVILGTLAPLRRRARSGRLRRRPQHSRA